MPRKPSNYLILSVFLLVLMACSVNSTNRNPFLPEVGFRFDINLNLPLYSDLNNPGNPVYIGNNGVGIRGVFIINTGFGVFRAFEASCPNQVPSNCSTMRMEGTVAKCDCDDFEYSLFTGQQLNRPDDGNRYYDMLEYRANASGNLVIISN